jgi:hypothetical protein
VLLSVDTWLMVQLVGRAAPEKQPQIAQMSTWIFGVTVGPAADPVPAQSVSPTQPQKGVHQQKAAQQSASRYRAWQLEQARQQGRRNFVWGTLTGGASMLVHLQNGQFVAYDASRLPGEL